MSFKSINLAIVDDNTLFRKTLRSYLSEQKNINVAILASDLADLFEKMRHLSIDVLLMDVFMRQLSGSDAVREIQRKFPAIKILIMAKINDMDMICDFADFGIHGYVSKSDEPEDLIQAIITASQNMIYRSKMFTEALYWGRQNNVNVRIFSGKTRIVLDEREKKILQLLWQEKSNREIADELFLGVRSVEKIRQGMKDKVGAKSTVGLLKYAINKKIIETYSPEHFHNNIGWKQ